MRCLTGHHFHVSSEYCTLWSVLQLEGDVGQTPVKVLLPLDDDGVSVHLHRGHKGRGVWPLLSGKCKNILTPIY